MVALGALGLTFLWTWISKSIFLCFQLFMEVSDPSASISQTPILLREEDSALEFKELASLSISMAGWLLTLRKLSFPLRALIVSMVFRCDIIFDYGIQYQIKREQMSTSLHMENPEPFMQDLHGKLIGVQLKWGWELRGILQSKDQYMNLLLANAEEIVNGEKKGELGEILIRCNNILYIREVTE